MEMVDKGVCAGCHHEIDASARVCPYCGADPHTGEKIVDTQAILQEEFHRRKVSLAEGVLEYARHHQGVVIAAGIVVLIVILAGVHAFIAQRNVADVSSAPAVPLTDIADLNSQSQESQALPMPALKFQYDGNPKTMRTLLVEPGAVAPAPQPAPTTSNPATPSH